MGGNLSYEYLGETFQGSNQYQYRITLTTFLDCTSPYWGSGFPETSLEIGIFEGSASPGATMPLQTSLTLPLIDSVPVVPPLPNGCSVPNIPCVYQITYVQTVNLPLSFSGYHLYYERCCRNGTILNLANPGGEGMVFSAYIPPTIAVNNSPVFTDMPVPFICVNDTTGILNTATDPDGDLLIFSFENPYEGEYTDGTSPALGAYPDPINWPFPPATWQTGGFNKNSPFGPSGYAFINSFTGYSLYKPPATGNYVVAVEIKEYRNGNLIGITRRDMQLLVIACNPNAQPVLSNSGGSGTTSYTIQEGQSLCFPITFTDANSITLTATGNIFNSSFTNPPATVNSPVSGSGSVTTQFCWNTGCNQGQSLPYLFNAEATDNGCPPKTTPIVYSITINNFSGPTSITGINSVCPGISGLIYSTTAVTGATYNWVVTGGTIVSGQGTNSITVNWGTGSSGNVAVTTTSQYGCSSGPINLPVTINPAINVFAGTDKSVCVGDTVTIGSYPTAPSGTILTWSPPSGLDNPNIQNPVASPVTTTTYIATATSTSGCSGKDTVVVTVNSLPVASAGPDTTICLGGSVQLNAGGGSTYQWIPSGPLNNPNIQNPVATPTDTTSFMVIVSSPANCKDTDSVTVFIITSVPADAGINKIICMNDSVLIGGTTPVPQGTGFSWMPGGSLNNDTIQNPYASPDTATTYIMTITTPDGCTGTDSVTVSVNQLPAASAGNDKLICPGDTVQLAASGGGSYLWWPGTGLSSTTIANPLAFPTDTTEYFVTITDGNNCKNSDSVLVIIAALPFADAGTDKNICVGDSVQLSAVVTGIFGWSPSVFLSDDSITDPFAFPPVTTTYVLSTKDSNQCENLDSLTVTVNNLPVADAGTDMELCIFDTLQLNASGGAFFSWIPSDSLNDDSIANPLAFPVDTTEYFVTVTDTNGCSATDSVLIFILPLPSVSASGDTTICSGEVVQLSATGGSAVLWSPADSLSNPALYNPFANPSDTTLYIATVTDGKGCINSDSVIINVKPTPIADAGTDGWVCPGDSVQLNATGGNFFTWSPAATLSNPGIASPMAGPSDTIKYFVDISNIYGCSKGDSVTVFVNGVVPTEAGDDKFICINDSVLLGGSPSSPNGSTFLWTPFLFLDDNLIANPTAFPTDTMMYYLTTTNDTCTGTDSVKVIVNSLPSANAGSDTSICLGDTVQLQATGGIGFKWTPFLFLSVDSIADPLAFPTDTQKYFLTITDANNCSNVDSVTVAVKPLPPANAGADQEICLGDSTQLVASGGISYIWSPAFSVSDDSIFNPIAKPADTTDYIVRVTDSNSCSKTDTVTVIVNPLPEAEAGTDKEICYGDTVQLGASGGIAFAWNNPATLSDDSIADPFSFPPDTTLYFVTVTDSNGCSGKDSVLVSVNPLPVADAGLNKAICIGDTVQLSASGGIIYVWTPEATLSDDSIPDPYAFPSDTTLYFVTVTDSNSCISTDSVMIEVNGLPVVSAGSDQEICLGDSAQLSAGGGIDFVWTPAATLNDDSIQNPLAFPADTTAYMVQVWDTNGCSNTDTVIILVNPLPEADAGSDNEICFGDTVQLNASGGLFFVWDNPNTLSDDSIGNPLAFPSDTTVYHLTVTDTNLCAKADSVTVLVNPLPNADAGFNKEICIGDSLQLLASGGTEYLWVHDSTLSNDSIPDPIAFPLDTTTYFVEVTDAKGCSKTDSVQIDVNDLPVVTAGSDTSSCKNTDVLLGGAPTGPAGSTYFWSPSSELNNNTLANPTANTDSTTVFYVVVSDTNGCKNSDSAVVSIFSVSSISDTSFCSGDSVLLFVVPVSGAYPTTFAWSPAAGLSSNTDSAVKASPDSSIVYTVIVTDGKGCVETRTISVVVNQPPLADFELSLWPNCEGVVARFSNNSEGADSFQWLFGDGETSQEENVKHFFPFDKLLEVTLTAYKGDCRDEKYLQENIKSFTDYFALKMPNIITPNQDGLNDCLEIEKGSDLGECTDLHIFNRWGELMYVSAGNQSIWCGRTFAGEEVPGGTYFYLIDVKGIVLKGTVMVVR